MKRLLLAFALVLGFVSGASADIRDFRTIFKSTGGTVSRSPQDKGSDTLSFKDFGAKCDGAADDTTKINAAIAWLNVAPYRSIVQIGGNCKISGPLDVITQSDVSLIGQGARIQDIGTNGNVFSVNGGNRIHIQGFTVNWGGTISPNDFFIDLISTSDSHFGDFIVTNCPSLFRYGSLGAVVQRTDIRNITGNCNKGITATSNILIRNGTGSVIDNITVNIGTTDTSAASGNQAIVRFAPVLGSELTTNGTFAADASWTKGTGWTIAAGVATHASGTGASISQAIALTAAKTYRISYTVSGRTAGTINARLSGGANVDATVQSTNGTFTQDLVAGTAPTTVEFVASATFDGSIDNVSVVQAGSSLDTFWITNSQFQVFNNAHSSPGDAWGKAYGIYIDRTGGDVTNLNILATTIDHTTIAGVYATDSSLSGAASTSRNWNIEGNRISPDTGHGVNIDFSASTGVTRGLRISENHFIINDDSQCIKVVGRTTIKGSTITGNRCGDLFPGTAKVKAVSLDMSDYELSDNIIFGHSTTTGWTTAIKVEHADNDNFTISNDQTTSGIAYLSEPAPYTTINGNRRIIGGKIEQEIIPTADTVNSTIAYADITGFLCAVDANATYYYEGLLTYEAAATTTGINFNVDSTLADTVRATTTWNLTASQTAANNETIIHQRGFGSANNATATVDTANSPLLGSFRGILVTGPTAGTLRMRVKSTVAASAVTVRKDGTVMRCRKKVG